MQAVIWIAAVVMTLLALAFICGFIVDSTESIVSFPAPLPDCQTNRWSSVISIPTDEYSCTSYGPKADVPNRSVEVQLTEISRTSLTVAVDISTTESDPWVGEVRRGDEQQDPASFAVKVVGFLQVAGRPFSWSAPVLQQQVKPGKDVLIMLHGTEPVTATGRMEIVFYPTTSGVVRLAAAGSQVTEVKGESSVRNETGKSVALGYPGGGKVVIDLTKAGTSSAPEGSAVTLPSSATQGLVGTWRIIRDFAESLLSVIPWIVFFQVLAIGRRTESGLILRRSAVLRTSRLIGAVLLAHLIVWGAVAIGAQDSTFSLVLGHFWQSLEFAQIPGVTVLFMGLVVMGALSWADGPRSYSRSYQQRQAVTWAVASVVSAAVALWGLDWLLDSGAVDQGGAGLPLSVLLATGLIGIRWLLLAVPGSVLYVTAVLLKRRSRESSVLRVGPLMLPSWSLTRSCTLAAVVVFLAIAAGATGYSGYLPLLVRWAGLIGVGTVMGLAVISLVTVAMRGRRPRLRYWTPAAAVLAVPWGLLGGGAQLVGWPNILQYAVRLDDLLPLVLISGCVVLLRQLGAHPVNQEQVLRKHRILGVGTLFIVLSSSYTFASSVSLPGVAAMAAAAVVGWLLMPSGRVATAALILRQFDQEQAQAVTATLHAGAARRIVPGYSKALRDKVSSGDLDFEEAQNKIGAMEQRAAIPVTQGPNAASVLGVTAAQLGFGALASPGPWDRAIWGARWGAVVGAPWVLLGVAGGAVFNVGSAEGYPVLAIVAFIAPLVLRWVAYGFLFGYFYPLLRGSDGLSKGLWFSTAAVIPALVSTLSTSHAGTGRWESMALLAIQIAAFGTTIGLLADREVLRKHGLPAGRIVDLHNLWAVSAWGSSIGLAVATGVATVIISGLQPFVIGTVAPSTAPATQQVSPPPHSGGSGQ